MSIINIVGAKIWGGGEQYVYDICKQLQQRHRAAYTLVDQSNEEMQRSEERRVGKEWRTRGAPEHFYEFQLYT